MRIIVAILLVAVAAAAQAAEASRTRYLALTNRAHDSVTAVAVAASGLPDFRVLPLGQPLRGGGGSATVAVPLAEAGCLHDIRVTFHDGRNLLQRDVDLCRHGSLRIAKLPSRAPTSVLPETALTHATE